MREKVYESYFLGAVDEYIRAEVRQIDPHSI